MLEKSPDAHDGRITQVAQIGLGLLMAMGALVLTAWVLTGGIAGLANLEYRDTPTRVTITITTIHHVPQPPPLSEPSHAPHTLTYGASH